MATPSLQQPLFQNAFTIPLSQSHFPHKNSIYQWYHQNILRKNAITLVIFATFILLLIYISQIYFFLDREEEFILKNEAFLKSISEIQRISIQNKVDMAKMYVDVYQEIIMLESEGEQSVEECDGQLLECQISDYKEIYGILGTRKPFLKNFLTFSSITASFIISRDKQNWLYHKLPLPAPLSTTQLASIIQNIPSIISSAQNYYSLTYFETNKAHTITLCSILSNFSICSIQLVDLHPGANTIMVNAHSTYQDKIKFLNSALENQILDYDTESKYGELDFSECITKASEVMNLISAKIWTCNGLSFGEFKKPVVTYTQHKIQVEYQYYRDSLLKIKLSDPMHIEMYVLSNASFYKSKNLRMNLFNLKIESITRCFILVLICWISLMPCFSEVLKKQLINSMQAVLKMGLIIKQINSKEDIEPKSVVFEKNYKQYARNVPIFQSTIQIFRHFIWYKALTYTTKVAKEKQLLEDGLTLFQSVQYAEILAFIYTKKIELLKKQIFFYEKLNSAHKQRPSLETDVSMKIFNARQKRARNSNNTGDQKSLEKSMTIDRSEDQESLHCSQKILEEMIHKKLISISQNKNKKGVRFSNEQIFLDNEEKPHLRASRFMLSIPSQSQILKFSQKSIDEQIKKVEREEEPIQNQISEKTLSYFHDDNTERQNNRQPIINMKFHEDEEHQETEESQQQGNDLKTMTQSKIIKKLAITYEQLISYYNSIIVIKSMYIKTQPTWQNEELYKELYELYTNKTKYLYKLLKIKNKRKQKKQKILSEKLINLKKERRVAREFNKIDGKILGSQKLLISKISLLEDQYTNEAQNIDTSFKEFWELQETQKIQLFAIQKASLYQSKLLKILNYPIPYKQLESLCDSSSSYIKVEAQFLMASEFSKISPHADMEILIRLTRLLEEQTTHTQKRKITKLLCKILNHRQALAKQSLEMQSIRNYYNFYQKKFYFIADFSDTFDLFMPFLKRTYDCMNKVDVYDIYNLAMNECTDDMITCENELKPRKFQDFLQKFEILHSQITKIRSMGSSKVYGKKVTYEKDFNKILSNISLENCSSAKYLVLLLGGESENQSRTHEDYESSCAYNRQFFQALHQEMINKMQRNYFHVILVGFNLKDFQTKQGKLKKYAKHTHDLLEIDLNSTKMSHEKLYNELKLFLENPS